MELYRIVTEVDEAHDALIGSLIEDGVLVLTAVAAQRELFFLSCSQAHAGAGAYYEGGHPSERVRWVTDWALS